MSTITMPEGTHLAYTVYAEAQWWRNLSTHGPETLPNGGHPCIQVAASSKGNGGGVRWEFSVVDTELYGDRPSLKLSIYDEGWEAFAGMAPFFAALASGQAKTLGDVRVLLDSLGAVDETERS